MRNILLFNSIGSLFETDYNGKIDVSDKKFIKYFFKKNGVLKTGNLLEILKYVHSDNDDLLERLSDIQDKFDIHIIYNDIEDKNNVWDINLFLSKLFSVDVYADNPVIIFAKSEIENCDKTSYEEFIEFKNLFDEIYDEVTYEYTDVENYLSKIAVMLPDDNCVLIDEFEKVKDFQDTYIGTKKLSNFMSIENMDNGISILKRPGIMMITNQMENNGMYFFSQYYSKILGDSEYKEIVS